jgi:hypothetical protein
MEVKHKLTYVGLIPLAERGGIDLDNSTLDEGVGTNKLIVRGIVHLLHP